MAKYKDLLKAFNPDLIDNMSEYIRLLSEKDSKKIGKLLENYKYWEEGTPFAITAFGEIFAYTSDNYVILYKLMEDESKVLIEDIEMLQQYLSDIDIQKQLFSLKLYFEAKDKIGILKNNECYIFEPIPALGGKKTIKNITKGDYIAYICLIMQIV